MRDNLDPKELLEKEVPQARLVQMAPQVKGDNRDQLGSPDLLENVDYRESPDLTDLGDQMANLVRLDCEVNMDQLERLDHLDLQDNQVCV